MTTTSKTTPTATNPIFATYRKAVAHKKKLERLGGTVSQPYISGAPQQWRLTVVHWGK